VAAHSSEKLVTFYQSTQQHIARGSILNSKPHSTTQSVNAQHEMLNTNTNMDQLSKHCLERKWWHRERKRGEDEGKKKR
jgi:hypothetical protein